MKFLASIAAALVLSACSPRPQLPSNPQIFSVDEKDTVVYEFVQLCSSVPITGEVSGLIAVANCLGRINGFATGANVATELYKTPKLWCIAPQQPDRDVMSAVLAWVQRNPEQYQQYVDNFDAPTASAAAIIQGLRESFPCKNT